MNQEPKWAEKLIKEHQDFADSIVWQNDDGSEKYIAVGNMADWWINKIKEGFIPKEEVEVLIQDIRGSGDVDFALNRAEFLKNLDKMKNFNLNKE